MCRLNWPTRSVTDSGFANKPVVIKGLPQGKKTSSPDVWLQRLRRWRQLCYWCWY